MGNTQRLGTLVNGMTVDASGNVGIGGSPSGSYKLQVTGTTNLIGALNGTSATFSGALTVTNNVTIKPTSGYNAYFQTSGTALRINYLNDALSANVSASYRATDYSFQDGSGSAILTLASTGAATFSSSVGINGGDFRYRPNGDVTNSPALVFKDAGNSALDICAEVIGDANASSRPIAFRVSNPDRGRYEAMRITSAGRFGFGTTTTDWFFNVVTASGGYISKIQNSRNVSGDVNTLLQLGNNCNNTSSYFLVCSMDLGDRMYIYGNGNVVNINNSYGVLSDIKLKENIVDATPKLDDLLKVKIRNYNLIGEETKQIGVVAQELEEIFPSMVEEVEDFKEVEVEDEEGNITKERQSLGTTTKSVKMSVFVPMLIKAIQEQNELIQELSAKVSALENKS